MGHPGKVKEAPWKLRWSLRGRTLPSSGGVGGPTSQNGALGGAAFCLPHRGDSSRDSWGVLNLYMDDLIFMPGSCRQPVKCGTTVSSLGLWVLLTPAGCPGHSPIPCDFRSLASKAWRLLAASCLSKSHVLSIHNQTMEEIQEKITLFGLKPRVE